MTTGVAALRTVREHTCTYVKGGFAHCACFSYCSRNSVESTKSIKGMLPRQAHIKNTLFRAGSSNHD